MSPSKVLYLFCLSVILGIFFGSIVKLPQIYIWGFLILAIIFIFLSVFFKKLSYIIGFLLLFLIIGFLRFQVYEYDILNSQLLKLNGSGRVSISGTVIDEPEIRETSQKIKVKVLDGLVLITTNKYPEYKYLDKLKIEGKLETPTETEEFSYKNYLMKDGVYSVMDFPKIEVVGKEKAGIFEFAYSGVLFLKQKARIVIQKNFTPPYSQVLQGIIIGDKNAISKEVKNKFGITGVSHIVAVSGSHIVILGSIIIGFLSMIGLSRRQSFYFVVLFICFYILLVGLPASGVRAGIMGIVYLLAQHIGRQNTSSRIIIVAAAIMLLINPLLLIYDIGFQLSFLAVFGLIYFEPIIRYFIKSLIKRLIHINEEKINDSFIMMISTTLSAQIFTLPIIIYNFGNISFVSPIVNILILPVIYYVMLFGFLSSLAGIILPWLGWLLSIPCYYLMVYFMWVVDLFYKNWAFSSIKNISFIWFFILYIILFFVVKFLRKKLIYSI